MKLAVVRKAEAEAEEAVGKNFQAGACSFEWVLVLAADIAAVSAAVVPDIAVDTVADTAAHAVSEIPAGIAVDTAERPLD